MATRHQPPVWLLSLWLSLCYFPDSLVRAQQCTVCRSLGPPSVPWPDKQLGVAGVPLDTCGGMEGFAVAFAPESELCRIVHSLGGFCGCNVDPDSCHLCWDGSPVPNAQLTLPNYQVIDYLPPGIPATGNLNCEQLQSILHYGETKDSTECLSTQLDVGETCGCPSLTNDKNITTNPPNLPNRTMEPISDSLTTNASEPVIDRCSICYEGGEMAYPDKILEINEASQNLTCRQWEGIASIEAANSESCSLFRVLTAYCGCPLEQIACHLCPNGEQIPKPTQTIDWLFGDSPFVSTRVTGVQSADVDTMSCDLMASVVASEDGIEEMSDLVNLDSDLLCTSVQLRSWICGCSPHWKQYLLTWCYRISGMFSFLGSSFIVFDVLRKPRKNRFTTYHQFVLGISFYDIISSVAYTLVAVMAPYQAGFHLSRGNDATCTLQGFMIQLGQASMFYNICLAIYFLLVIVYNWKERMFRRICLASHVLVFVFGAGLAFGAIPFIVPLYGVCGVLPPLTRSQWQVSLFYSGPVSVTLVLLTVVTAMICRKVYQQQRKARKWMSNQSLATSRRVFWQSFWYVMAFYVTLPPVLLTFYIEFETPQHYWLLVLAATLAPLQGFMNTLVYFQRSRRQKAARSLFQCVRRRWTKKGDDEKGDVSLVKKTQEIFPESQSAQTDKPHESIVESPAVACQPGLMPAARNGDHITTNDGASDDTNKVTDLANVKVSDGNKLGVDNEVHEEHQGKETMDDHNESDNDGREDVSGTGKAGNRGEMSISGIEQHWVLNEEWDTSFANTLPVDRSDEEMIDEGDYESVDGFSLAKSISFRSLFG